MVLVTRFHTAGICLCTLFRKNLSISSSLIRIFNRRSFSCLEPTQVKTTDYKNTWASRTSCNYSNNSTTTALSPEEEKRVATLFEGLINGERAAIARSITLVESVNVRKILQAQKLLQLVLEEDRRRKKDNLRNAYTFRIGLSGPPGAGKSTFIETFGKFLTAKNHKVAVLAVDPSSSATGGSLLGDKTRMPQLSVDPNAYIRPSPASGTLGGVTRATNDAIVVCEGGGFDIILVETVGVGQSEYAVSNMVDLFVLLIPPAGGDELQGIKKGIVEVADLVVVNKSDGDLVPAARRIQGEYISALKYVRRKNKAWRPKVLRISSLKCEGVTELWERMEQFHELMLTSGDLQRTRQQQHKVWMWSQISDRIMSLFRAHPAVRAHVTHTEHLVANSVITAGQAADLLLSKFSEKEQKESRNI